MGKMSQAELILHRRNLDYFINTDYVMVSFNREAQTSDSMGGRLRNVDTIIAPQKVRVIPARSRSSSMVYTLPTGETLSSKDSLLLGRYDLDVEMKDWFVYEGNAFQVTFVRPERTTETICQLDLLGENWRSNV